MDLHPYRIRFSIEGESHNWVMFAYTFSGAMGEALRAIQTEFPRVDATKIRLHIQPAGEQAEARVGGILRGGWVFRDHFYFHAGPTNGPQSVHRNQVTDLRFIERKEGAA